MENSEKIGLVLEGGGMRGIYTAGVLDEFLLNDIWPDGLVGVSAGIIHAVSYLSEQYGRDARYYAKYSNNKRFMSLSSLIKTGDLCEVEFCYHELPEKLSPFDHETFIENAESIEALACCTNLETGEADFIRLRDLREDMDVVRASASLPLVSRIVEVNGVKYLDGGTADSIPLEEMIRRGYSKNVVILTRPEGYVKKEDKTMPLMKKVYKDYPKYIEASERRAEKYNASLEKIAELEKKGDVFVIRPSRDLKLGRTERNVEKIKRMYKLGRFDTQKKLAELKSFLGIQNA